MKLSRVLSFKIIVTLCIWCLPLLFFLAGLVSNGLAASFLIGFGVASYWQEWSLLGCIYMWASAVATASITIGLLVARR